MAWRKSALSLTVFVCDATLFAVFADAAPTTDYSLRDHGVYLRAADFLVLFSQALSVDKALVVDKELVGKKHFEAEPTFY